MNALLLALSFFLFSFSAHAIRIQVTGKNGDLLYKTHVKINATTTVGDVTVTAFERGEVPYEGGNYGISKLFGLSSDIEIISDTEMKAYGWCFDVDGVAPDTMPDETSILPSNSLIEWYYAYGHYKDGDWVGYCVRD